MDLLGNNKDVIDWRSTSVRRTSRMCATRLYTGHKPLIRLVRVCSAICSVCLSLTFTPNSRHDSDMKTVEGRTLTIPKSSYWVTPRKFQIILPRFEPEAKKKTNVGVRKLEQTRLSRTRRRWEDNINMDLKEIGWEGVDWIHLAQDRDRWQDLVNTVMNLWVLWTAGNVFSNWATVSQELCSKKLLSFHM
jgi:hypothetical protein